jgi:hypothetical protein
VNNLLLDYMTHEELTVVLRSLIGGVNERGGTLLVADGDVYFLGRLKAPDLWVEVSFHPDNYPAVSVAVIRANEEELTAHVQEYKTGWYVRKANLTGLRYDSEYGVFSLTRCKFCQRTIPEHLARTHDDGWVCNGCWDERLRTTE